MSEELIEAKKRLAAKLGPNYSSYIQLLGYWFRGFIPKEEFDEKARQFIDQNSIADHNKFWLAFFHHCVNNPSSSLHSRNIRLNNKSNIFNNQKTNSELKNFPNKIKQTSFRSNNESNGSRKCLPTRLLARMKIIVIAWEMGLDSVNDKVSYLLDLSLKQFLKNIIAETIASKTAYRLRENKFKYAFGVKPINPHLRNSMKVFSANLEYDPYVIEATRMNSSVLDTFAYNDTLFPSRLYEGPALYEYACSTTHMNSQIEHKSEPLNINHLMNALLTNRSIIPSNSLYSTILERIYNKSSNKQN